MSLLGFSPVRRLLRRRRLGTCFVCQRPVLDDEERMRLRTETLVHRRCASYRMRTRPPWSSRAGFPR